MCADISPSSPPISAHQERFSPGTAACPHTGPHPTADPNPPHPCVRGHGASALRGPPDGAFPGTGPAGPGRYLPVRGGQSRASPSPRDTGTGPWDRGAVPRAGTEPRASTLREDHRAHASLLTQRHPDPAPVPAQRHRTEPNGPGPPAPRPGPPPPPRLHLAPSRREVPPGRGSLPQCPLPAGGRHVRRGEAAPPREPRGQCSARSGQQAALSVRGLRRERWGRAGAGGVGCPIPSRRVSVW